MYIDILIHYLLLSLLLSLCIGQGNVFVYKYVDQYTMWTRVQTLTIPSSTEFGFAITVQGYTMVISAPRTGAPTGQNSLDITNEPTTSVGAVYVYKYSGGLWVLSQTLTQSLYPGTQKSVQNFGQSVALSPDLSTLIIGAPFKGMLT